MQSEQKSNAIAVDLWSQMFSRGAESSFAAIIQPGYDPAEDEARTRQGFIAAGWPLTEVEAMIEECRVAFANAPVTSPGVAPHVELRHEKLCHAIEGAMGRLGLKTHLKVARGIEPCLGPSAAKIGVIMTVQSVITVSSFFFRFCGLIAKAYLRTLRLSPFLWEPSTYSIEQGLKIICANPQVLNYWMRINNSFAFSGTNIGVPFLASTMDEQFVVEQIAEAMELFAIAHEYGHHHSGHGRSMDNDFWYQEYEADQFALKICDEINRNEGSIENPYLTSGAGGVVILRAMENLRKVEKCLGAAGCSNGTHPPVSERISRFDSVRIMVPEEFRRLKGFRLAADRAMTLVGTILEAGLSTISSEDIVRYRHLRQSLRGH